MSLGKGKHDTACTSATKRFFCHRPKKIFPPPCRSGTFSTPFEHARCCIFSEHSEWKAKKRLSYFSRVPSRGEGERGGDISTASAVFDNGTFKRCGNRKQDCCPVRIWKMLNSTLSATETASGGICCRAASKSMLPSCLIKIYAILFFFSVKFNCEIQIAIIFL